MEEIAIHSVVLSVAGRDSGRLFAVIGFADANYALIADGRLRRLEKPKKKKLRHLKKQGELETGFATNRELHGALNAFAEQHAAPAKRGVSACQRTM